MKTIFLASVMLISGVAYAQADPRDAGQPVGSGATLQPGTTMGERDTMGPESTTPPAAEATAPMPDATMPPPSTTTMGTTGSGTMVVQEGGNMTPPPADTGPYPKCSRTVTDHCTQDESRARDTRRPRR